MTTLTRTPDYSPASVADRWLDRWLDRCDAFNAIRDCLERAEVCSDRENFDDAAAHLENAAEKIRAFQKLITGEV